MPDVPMDSENACAHEPKRQYNKIEEFQNGDYLLQKSRKKCID